MKWNDWWAYRHITAFAASFNILLMMIANLIGFSIGLDGVLDLLKTIFHTWSGWVFVAETIVCLFVGVQVMFEYRETEKRKGIFLRY